RALMTAPSWRRQRRLCYARSAKDRRLAMSMTREPRHYLQTPGLHAVRLATRPERLPRDLDALLAGDSEPGGGPRVVRSTGRPPGGDWSAPCVVSAHLTSAEAN